MSEGYDATKDPRSGRPIPPADLDRLKAGEKPSWVNNQAESETERQQREHHSEGIPPYDIVQTDALADADDPEETDSEEEQAPAVMKAPPEGWDEEPDEQKPSTYQASIENASISSKDYELTASGVVTVEEYKGEEFITRIAVEVCIEVKEEASLADAHSMLLDAALDSLRAVCELDREVLRRSIVSL
jgi:hypothetical protein